MGLSLYSLGAILFWPVAKFSVGTTNPQGIFGGFVVCTAGIAAVLPLSRSLPTPTSRSCPSHVANFLPTPVLAVVQRCRFVLGPPHRLQGTSSPTANSDNLTNVQWVYLAVSGMGLVIAAAFFFTKLPDVSEADCRPRSRRSLRLLAPTRLPPPSLSASSIESSPDSSLSSSTSAPGHHRYLFLNYSEQNANIGDSQGSQLLSYGLITFTVARFIGTALLSVVAAPLLLAIFAAACVPSRPRHRLGARHARCHLPDRHHGLRVDHVPRHLRHRHFRCWSTHSPCCRSPRHGCFRRCRLPPDPGCHRRRLLHPTSYYLVVPCFVYICGWALWVWNKEGRRLGVPKEAIIDHESNALPPPTLASPTLPVRQGLARAPAGREDREVLDHSSPSALRCGMALGWVCRYIHSLVYNGLSYDKGLSASMQSLGCLLRAIAPARPMVCVSQITRRVEALYARTVHGAPETKSRSAHSLSATCLRLAYRCAPYVEAVTPLLISGSPVCPSHGTSAIAVGKRTFLRRPGLCLAKIKVHAGVTGRPLLFSQFARHE